MNPEYLRLIGDHLWQSTLCAGVAGLVTLALRKNRARVRHAVWLVASCKFLLPFSVLVALGAHIPWRTAPMTIASPVSIALGEAGHPFTGPAFESTVLPVHPSAHLLPSFLFGTWLCGFVGIALSWWVRWRRIRAAAHSGTPVHLDITIRAVSCPGTIQPGVFGIFRPVLLLPEDIFHRLTPAQLSAVIAHELCHVRHRDNLIAVVQMLVETIFWFHPLVWWIGKRMIAERERACDEEVLRLGIEPNTYAESILRVCALYVESPLACLSGVTGSGLKKRIQAIVGARQEVELGFARKVGLAAAGMACVASPIVVGALNAPPLWSQTQSSPLATVKFRSVSIEPCTSYTLPSGVTSPAPGRLVLNCQTVMGLIDIAYVRSAMGGSRDPWYELGPISGRVPGWAMSASYRYQIDARAYDRASVETMEGPMLQALLEDRFKLGTHRLTKAVPMYALTVTRNGARLRRSNEGSCAGAWLRDARFPQPPLGQNCIAFAGREAHYEALEGEAINLEQFCQLLASTLGRPVINKTGINGKFDFHLKFASDGTPRSLSSLYPPLFRLLEEQLGLKLEPLTGPREFLVVDRVEKPLPG